MTAIVHILVGPTASGKSALAVQKAIENEGVIINADALQIYDELPILTTQPPAEDKARAPHRLYGVLPSSNLCSATQWVDLAIAEIEKAFAEGLTPIIVGGTGFYIKALMEGLSIVPEIPPEIRQVLNQKQAEMGNPAFHEAFSRHDPVMAARLHPNDTQRLIRAWEVWEATGESLATWQSQQPKPPRPDWRFDITVLEPERTILYQRCNQRFLNMMESGIIEEVKSLSQKIADGQAPERGGITQALGFIPLRSWIQGEISKDDAIIQSQTDTRQYAKRQVTWLRNQIKPADNIVNITRLTL